MVGGVISGYCATGSLNTATSPSSVIRIDGTDAKIGTVNEETREHGRAGLLGRLAAAGCLVHRRRGRRRPGHILLAQIPRRHGRIPVAARCSPLTITQSSGPMPDSITVMPSCRLPTLTFRYSTVFSLFTVSRYRSL